MRQRLQARIDMLMENIALRHQLMVYERGRTARRSLSGNDRLLWLCSAINGSAFCLT